MVLTLPPMCTMCIYNAYNHNTSYLPAEHRGLNQHWQKAVLGVFGLTQTICIPLGYLLANNPVPPARAERLMLGVKGPEWTLESPDTYNMLWFVQPTDDCTRIHSLRTCISNVLLMSTIIIIPDMDPAHMILMR